MRQRSPRLRVIPRGHHGVRPVGAALRAAKLQFGQQHVTISKPHVRKEDVVARVLQHRGDHPGLVHIISAMEACDAYKPWHDKQTHKTFIRPDSGKCLHYYFYVQDAQFGLVYLRVPTWARVASSQRRRCRTAQSARHCRATAGARRAHENGNYRALVEPPPFLSLAHDPGQHQYIASVERQPISTLDQIARLITRGG